MVDMDGPLNFPILVDHLVIIRYTTDSVGAFPSRQQLRGVLWWCGYGIDEASYLIRVGDGRWGWRGHLLVGELELLGYGFDILGGIIDRG